MTNITCPHCGCSFDPDAELLPVTLSDRARRVLETAPNTFRRGGYVSIRTLAGQADASPRYVLLALRELVDAGFVQAIPYGNGKHRYIGIPTMIMHRVCRRAA